MQIMLPQGVHRLNLPLYISKNKRFMNIYVNGNTHSTDAEFTIIQLLKKIEILDVKGVAIAVNEEIIPKNEWEIFFLKENDKVLIITATKGG